MKLTLPILIAATTAVTAGFQRLRLPDPQNWIAGSRLFPRNVIAGNNADYGAYNQDTWAARVLEQCKGFAACTSSISFSAINSGTPKDRAWFGYAFRGGKTTEADYHRFEGVQDTVVYVKK